jgi:hypothetical protein
MLPQAVLLTERSEIAKKISCFAWQLGEALAARLPTKEAVLAIYT